MTHKLIHTPDYLLVVDDSGTRIAHLPLNNSPILEGVDLLAPLETEDFNPTGEYTKEYMSSLMFDGKSFVSDVLLATRVGYNKAKEKYKYTEEDIDKAYWAGMKFVGEDKGSYGEFIQSLSQPKMPVEFECEWTPMNPYEYTDEEHLKVKPKTTINPQGYTQWVGKYIY